MVDMTSPWWTAVIVPRTWLRALRRSSGLAPAPAIGRLERLVEEAAHRPGALAAPQVDEVVVGLAST